jgi:beta-ureidopropionase / N-carbamoyl-L-amino-acid hydrolase
MDRATLRSLAAKLFADVAARSRDGEGITRESYGPTESGALDLLEGFAHSEGLTTARDAAQNLVVGLPDEASGAAIYVGSHLDSVPQGGNFDGLAGVVAGLLCLVDFKREGAQPPSPVRVLGLRGEESAWFGRAYMGSSALLGKLTAEDLELRHRDDACTLAEAMARTGVPVERVRRGERLFDVDGAAAYLELHIEQGPVMVAGQWPTAIVTGIRGNVRHKHIVCRGETGHSGAVPRWLRRDAVLATAELMHRADEHWGVWVERGADLVVTFGIVSTDPRAHAMSRIPGEVTFSFEARSQSRETLEAFYGLFRTECESVATERKVEFEFDRRLESPPARMDERWVVRLLELSARLDLPAERLPSGAGHDAAMFAETGVPSGMIFIRNEHGSHNPREAMALDDFVRGVELLRLALRNPV